MNEKYVAQDIEKKWQKYWEDNHTFKTEYDESKEKYYVLEMFHTHLVTYTWVTYVTIPSVT